MLKTFQNLSNRFNMFTPKNYAIYVLDDYIMHLMPEIKGALFKRGYILVVNGGGVTGDIQVKHTDVHSSLKAKYRQLEQDLMIRQLTEYPQKIPQPSRNDMMRKSDERFRSLKIDFASRFKAFWVTKTLDRSKDHLVSERVYSLAAKEIIVFRNDLMEKPIPKSLKELMKMITLTKGVQCKFDKIREDEGEELFDCEGDKTSVATDEADDDPNDEISSSEDNVADNDHVKGESASTGEDHTTHSEISSLVKLADVCTDDDDDDDDDELKKDAKFIDDMDALLLNYEASHKLMPMYLKMQRQQIKARRNVKERLAAKGNKEPQKQRVIEMEQEEQGDEYINAFDFLNNF